MIQNELKGSYALVMYEFSIHHPLSYVILCYENKKKYFSILKPTLWLWKNYFGMQALFIYHAAFMSRNTFLVHAFDEDDFHSIFIWYHFDIWFRNHWLDNLFIITPLRELFVIFPFVWYMQHCHLYNIFCYLKYLLIQAGSLSHITECRHRWDLNYFLNVHFSFL